ncbi:hypothetical protein [Cupriavidus pauculus]|uniref:hypothetical protein n=1 Tax=Cupriavidus pauculus TaxID=82633 RepID=UPI001245BAA9|nr:hypothetical protein [Cupriavidus pauculus]KAB0601713.1 hypothetical protein F7R19_16130 [Cupriavidus pauculus]UAL02052.1 hypothetical protein K8O84_24940 [Cupriavidus pauculus]
MPQLSLQDSRASSAESLSRAATLDDAGQAGVVGQLPAIRLSLQRWGMASDMLRAMVDTLNAADPRVVWSDHEDGAPADLIVHMVDVDGLAGPSLQAPWNLLGPVDALRMAREQGIAAIVLAKGRARDLPTVRAGHWIASGPRNLVTAARILAGAAIVNTNDVDADARAERLAALASRNALACLHRVVAACPAMLASSVKTLIDSAQRDGYAAVSGVSIGVAPQVELELPSGSTPLQLLRSQLADTEADVLLSYPGPDLSMSAPVDESAWP